jgi:hypothetical protein
MGQATREGIPKADVVSADDTRWPVGGERAYLTIVETGAATVVPIGARPCDEEVRAAIDDDHPAVLVPDRGGSCDAEELEGVEQQRWSPQALGSIDRVPEIKRGRARHLGARFEASLKGGPSGGLTTTINTARRR